MGKTTIIIQTMWQRAFTYRFTIGAYRIGEIIEIFFLVILWTALYQNTSTISGYTLPEMITYILIGNLILFSTRNFLSEFMAREIKDGALSLFLIKPLTYFRYAMTREVGRTSLPTFLSIGTHLVVVLFFLDKLVFRLSPLGYVILAIMMLATFIIELLLSYLIGLIAFWTHEVDGVYASIQRLKRFVSGSFFPLSLLPPLYLKISFALPFAYSFFVPTQLFLGKISLMTALRGIGIQIIWIFLLYAIITQVWKRGLLKYEGVGI